MLHQTVNESVFHREEKREEYYTAMLSITFMTLLGFMDDALDLPWRVKILLPIFGIGPLLCSYSGSTAMILPSFLRPLLMDSNARVTPLGALLSFAGVGLEETGAVLDLGYWFYLAIGLLAVFCTNAINIYAGVNGIEAGQSFCIGAIVLFFNLLQIFRGEALADAALSASLVLPFLGVTLGLLRHNWYPSGVFVGDTFCYFAGMTIAVCAIQGHYVKTLLLFLAPQLLNFALSLPQLLKLVPCPRHRLPRVDEATQLLHPSTFTLKERHMPLLRAAAGVGLTDTEVPNLTLLCAALRALGPTRERTLVVLLLALQLLVGAMAIWLRYSLPGVCFGEKGGTLCA